jgi:hypothetical protein
MFRKEIRESMADSRSKRYIRLKEQMTEIEEAVFQVIEDTEEVVGKATEAVEAMSDRVDALSSLHDKLCAQLKVMEDLFDEYEHRDG